MKFGSKQPTTDYQSYVIVAVIDRQLLAGTLLGTALVAVIQADPTTSKAHAT